MSTCLPGIVLNSSYQQSHLFLITALEAGNIIANFILLIGEIEAWRYWLNSPKATQLGGGGAKIWTQAI